MKTTYILIPGLGDHKYLFRWFYGMVSRQWSRHGMPTVVIASNWNSAEGYEDKYTRLRTEIAACREKGREVVLVGVSAGAGLGLLVYAHDSATIKSFVAVCGFTRLKADDRKNAVLMRRSWYQAADAAESGAAALNAEQKARIISFIPTTDGVIDPAQQTVAGATNIKLGVRGHMFGILWTLLGKRRAIARFVSSIS